MDRRWEISISGKQLDNVRKKTRVVSVMHQRLETDAIRDKEDNRLLLHWKRRHTLTERYPQKVQAAEGRSILEQEERFRAEIFLGGSVRLRHVILAPPVCLNCKSASGCTCDEKCRFRHAEVDGQGSKVEEIWCERISCIIKGGYTNWVLYLKILTRENVFHVKSESWDKNTPSSSPRHLAPNQNS